MIRKFNNINEAIVAGFCISLGNGEYAEGGEVVSRERYQKLFDAIKEKPDADATPTPVIKP